MRVLLGWEHGAGRGHLGVLWPLARSLAADGVQVVLYVRDLATAGSMPPLPGVRVLPLPYVEPPADLAFARPTHTLADILCGLGLSDAAVLTERVNAWRGVLTCERPDVVVTEFAPTLALAAMDDRPVVTVGVGYVCPPVGGAFPPIRFWEAEVPLASLRAEERLADAMDKARARSGLPGLAWPSDAFGGDAQVVCTWPELDTYAERRPAPAAGPARRFAFAAASDAPAFFYLAADAQLPGALQAVAASRLPARGFVRGLDPASRARLSRPGLEILADPPELEDVLPGCPLLIHHGGIGAAEAALALGTPQVILARHLEHVSNGLAVERRLGVGRVMSAGHASRDPRRAGAAIRDASDDPELRRRSVLLARTLAAREATTGAEKAHRNIDELVGGLDRRHDGASGAGLADGGGSTMFGQLVAAV